MSVERARRVGRESRSLYRLESMRVEDIPQIALIEEVSFSNPWPEQAFKDEIRKNVFSYPVVARLVSSSSDFVAGYCIKWVVFNELQVQNVAVHPQHRGRGLGGVLVEEALEYGRAARCRTAFLEVRESNTNARRLYVSMGFREVGKRKNYYSRPREHAVQYRKDLLDEGDEER
jgi:ribosomal-protein-alanine N-acetyltransferase